MGSSNEPFMPLPSVPPRFDTQHLVQRVLDRAATVVVVGQGYVGLTLACAAAEVGFSVTGIDIDQGRIQALGRGELGVHGVDESAFRVAFGEGRLTFTTGLGPIRGADLVFICVPTPLRHRSPDLKYIEDASRDIAANLRPGSLVVLESTTYPGTTETLVLPMLQASGLRAGIDFLLAYSPERLDPGNVEYDIRNTPRLVGGTTPDATSIAIAFYQQLVDKVIPMSSTRTAETAKLLENTFRHINIALVNELAMLCHELGIDVWEVIDAAATKPFGFMAFYPGPGVGGHCIPLDPTYLAWQFMRESGRRFGVLEQAQDVNERMPKYVASRAGEILKAHGRSVKGARILILGVSYKADVGDVRESPSFRAMKILHNKGAHVRFHDPYVSALELGGETMTSVLSLDGELAEADLVLLLTPHQTYDLDLIADLAPAVFDTRNAYGAAAPANVVRL
jgi:UDP-N-acetyl-D-glucosamine dehydrogenase